ncbi:hypothetical protein DAPPUDRAFT_268094 [Daphnia pulex]|uniref:Uncharacterized protein n=1 Tax=Daphnia pulex TaxID=6669 RepID=E9HX99_DAPPU|nr:hypothetical protein DAPPUDRAFT_268094 [Daphnia pulex]|eukprot:EFX63634.1 hypothetical protein DAPPUDRAFT_268094 [Daphnia pulex]
MPLELKDQPNENQSGVSAGINRAWLRVGICCWELGGFSDVDVVSAIHSDCLSPVWIRLYQSSPLLDDVSYRSIIGSSVANSSRAQHSTGTSRAEHYVLRPLRLLVRSRCRSSLQRSFLMESCGPGTEILEPMLAFVHERRVASTNVLLHLYLRDVRSTSFPASYANLQLVLLHWRVGSLHCSLPSAVTHLQSLVTGICPGEQQPVGLDYPSMMDDLALPHLSLYSSRHRVAYIHTWKGIRSIYSQ